MADTFRMLGNNAVIVVLLVVLLALIFNAADRWFQVSTVVEEVMVVLILLAIGVLGRKWRPVTSKKMDTKKEIHLPKTLQPRRTGQASKLAPADDNFCGEATDAGDSFTLRLRELARARDLAGVEQLAKEMRVAGIQPTVSCYGVVIDAFAKAGDLAGAERWLADFMDAGLGKQPNTVLVNIAISACAKAGNSSQAEEWFDRMSSLEVEPDDLSYNAVIDAHARSGMHSALPSKIECGRKCAWSER